ncbi:MAG: FAD-binding protein [Thermomicrobiales bacterium]
MPSENLSAVNGGYVIDGLPIGETAVPADAQETAAVLAEAHTASRAVLPVGGGTALGLGNLPERGDLVLSTSRLSGIIDYEPTDLVLSVGAGARIGDVQAVLAEHGQRLPLDAPGGGDATIGGLIATARSGPLRHSAGSLRDLLIGISVAHPSGTVSRAGGMVVKNVSGYDMPRLYHGSLGTLGVITSANFKVLPRPRCEATLLASFPSVAAAFAAWNRVRETRQPLAAIEISCDPETWTLAMRIEGREPTVAVVAERVSLAIGADVDAFGGPDSASWWANYVARSWAPSSPTQVVMRCGVRPRDTEVLLQGIVQATGLLNVSVARLSASPGLGVVTSTFDLGALGSAESLAGIQTVLAGLAETVTIHAAPPDWKKGIDVWGPMPEGFDVMRALRDQFDPGRVVNPGRFAGFL